MAKPNLDEQQFERIVAAVKQSFRISFLEITNSLPPDGLTDDFEDAVYNFLSDNTEEQQG